MLAIIKDSLERSGHSEAANQWLSSASARAGERAQHKKRYRTGRALNLIRQKVPD